MKYLVDLPDEYCESIKKKRDNNEQMHSINYLILMGDEIPNDASNGDVIVLLFHDCMFFMIDEYVIVKDKEGKQMFKASKTWWNAKYNTEEENEDGE